jgi:hypothetical protein
VEEIGDIEVENSKLFTEALENERERGLTDRQKTSLKKVREEDDAKKLHKQQRRASTLKSRSRCKRAAVLQTANGVAQVKKKWMSWKFFQCPFVSEECITVVKASKAA